jgi:hypothetical protein
MHLRMSLTSASLRSASAHALHAWTQFKHASIAAARSATSSAMIAGDASNISLVSVMLVSPLAIAVHAHGSSPASHSSPLSASTRSSERARSVPSGSV